MSFATDTKQTKTLKPKRMMGTSRDEVEPCKPQNRGAIQKDSKASVMMLRMIAGYCKLPERHFSGVKMTLPPHWKDCARMAKTAQTAMVA